MAKLIIEGEQRFLEKVAKQLRSNRKIKVSKDFESIEGNADENSVSPTITDETSGGGAHDMTTDNVLGKGKKGKK